MFEITDLPKICPKCGAEFISSTYVPNPPFQLAGYTFPATLPSIKCSKEACDFGGVDLAVFGHYQTKSVLTLLEAGIVNGEILKCVRTLIGGFKILEFAKMLGIPHDAVVSWEEQQGGVFNRFMVATMTQLLRDKLTGSTQTVDQLKALKEPRELSPVIEITL